MPKYTGCFSREEIESFKPPKDSVLICIRDPETFYPKVDRIERGYRFISHFDFWDLDKDIDSYGIKRKAALPEDVARIKETIDSFYDYHIFASCEAGIFRSAAVREYLFRRGWTLHPDTNQQHRGVHPNAYILASLERLNVKFS